MDKNEELHFSESLANEDQIPALKNGRPAAGRSGGHVTGKDN